MATGEGIANRQTSAHAAAGFVSRIATGDRAALNELYARHDRAIATYVRALAGDRRFPGPAWPIHVRGNVIERTFRFDPTGRRLWQTAAVLDNRRNDAARWTMGAVLAAIVLIVIGVLNLVAPDAMWSLTKFGNAWEGRQSERTEWWDMRRIIGGVGAIVLGIIVLIISAS